MLAQQNSNKNPIPLEDKLSATRSFITSCAKLLGVGFILCSSFSRLGPAHSFRTAS